MNTENVSTLKIHKLTKAQYERELGAGRIDPTAIYLTPNEELLSIEQGGTGANNAADALANLGAAPAGYGLGVATPEKEVSDCNLAVRNGWYKVTGNASNAPWNLSSWMRVDAYNENYLVQTIYNEANGGRTAQRLKAGTWGSWVNNSPTDFAPAGYGLGVQFPQSISSLADLDTLTQNGWYVISASASTLAGVYFNHAMVFVQCRYGSTYQELVPIKSTTKLRRYRYNDTWSEWEVENPPMIAGVEYRTTERCDGKPVYRKSVVYTHSGKFGDSATNTDYTIPHGISDWVRSVRCVTSINNDVTGSYLGSTGGILCVLGFGATNINVRVYKTYFNSPILRFDLAYIKE